MIMMGDPYRMEVSNDFIEYIARDRIFQDNSFRSSFNH